ncbi:MAG: HAD family acid phosphatase [Candidatus Eremiobacterota bacterium]
MRRLTPLVTFVAAIVLGLAPVRADSPRENPNLPILYSGLWMQNAAEYRALCLQAYQAATARLGERLEGGGRPPAVVMDLDETVLDNGPYQAWLYLQGQPFSEASWDAWLRYQADTDQARLAVPGAVEFIRWAEQRGITVVYVSNRPDTDLGHDASADTLERLGVSRPGPERLLLRGGKEAEQALTLKFLQERGVAPDSPEGVRIAKCQGAKERRRLEVQARYRVLAYFGDDLADFLAFVRPTEARAAVEGRFAEVEQNRARWGADWFILPNPVYGSWSPAQTLPASPAELPQFIDDRGFGNVMR